jgi:hypothetical protein
MLQSLDGPADQPLIGTDQQVGSLHLQFLRGALAACVRVGHGCDCAVDELRDLHRVKPAAVQPQPQMRRCIVQCRS